MLDSIELLRARTRDALVVCVTARIFLDNPIDSAYEMGRFDVARRTTDEACYQVAHRLVSLEVELEREASDNPRDPSDELERIHEESLAVWSALKDDSKRFMCGAAITAANAVNTLPPSVSADTRTHLTSLLRYRLMINCREPAAMRVLVRGLPAVACGCIPTAEVAGGC